PEHEIRMVLITFLLGAGVFGNFSFVIAVRAKKELRNKHGILLCIMCGVQTICLIFEALKLTKIAIHSALTREACFGTIFLYVFCDSYQAMGILIVGFDILYSLLAPIKYYNLRNFPYLLYLQLPSAAYALFFPIYSKVLNNPDVPIGDWSVSRRKSVAICSEGMCTKYKYLFSNLIY
ncbi:hypothetical protein PFISCL1PPCAC_17319, partial [Pristionchus fissidentatus]